MSRCKRHQCPKAASRSRYSAGGYPRPTTSGCALDLKHDGDVVATLQQRVDSKATALSKPITVKPASDSDGRIFVLLRVTGTSPTTVQAKVWQHGNAEPSAWTVRGGTTTPALQRKGSLGLSAYLYQPHNPKTAALRIASFVSSATAG